MSSLFIFVVLVRFFGLVVAQVSGTTSDPFPSTLFTCQGRRPGYYADVETGCRTYHVCDGISHFTYTCPRRTLFNQKMKICDYAYRVQCKGSLNVYNEDFVGGTERLFVDNSEENHLNKGIFKDLRNKSESFYTTPTYRATTPTFLYRKAEDPRTPSLSTLPPTTITTSTSGAPVTVTASTEPATTVLLEAVTSRDGPSSEKFLKFSLYDFRSLFFIPEVDGNSIATRTAKELVVPVDRSDLMRFKTEPVGTSSTTCPGYCNPKFFIPGTCHPCLMIK